MRPFVQDRVTFNNNFFEWFSKVSTSDVYQDITTNFLGHPAGLEQSLSRLAQLDKKPDNKTSDKIYFAMLKMK